MGTHARAVVELSMSRALVAASRIVGIGRRGALKMRCRKTCGFESHIRYSFPAQHPWCCAFCVSGWFRQGCTGGAHEIQRTGACPGVAPLVPG